MSSAAVIQFSSGAAAAGLIAGLPAAARATREAAMSGLSECWLTIADGETLALTVRQEITRLAGVMRVHGLDTKSPPGFGHGAPGNGWAGPAPLPGSGPVLLITGEALVDAASIRAALASGESRNPGLQFIETAAAAGYAVSGPGSPTAGTIVSARYAPTAGTIVSARYAPTAGTIASARYAPTAGAIVSARYAAASHAIIKATAKSTDGLVSRSINRPMSQAISRVLMHFPSIRPIHATMGTAVLAVLMFAVLVLYGSPAGLVAGAVLFQAASVFDGVDGEIARATYRTSDRGAMIDSLIDAATNLSFVAGIVINLAQRGRWGPAMFGIAGLAMLALGLTTLGTRARRSGAPITFDGLKGRFRDSGSAWGRWLVWLTMRDFLALATVGLVVAGLTEQAIMAFSAIMAVWLAVVLTSQVRQSALGR